MFTCKAIDRDVDHRFVGQMFERTPRAIYTIHTVNPLALAFMSLQRFKLVFFCPAVQTQRVLGDLFKRFPSQLGKIGNYEQCAFLTRGTGSVVQCWCSSLR